MKTALTFFVLTALLRAEPAHAGPRQEALAVGADVVAVANLLRKESANLVVRFAPAPEGR